MPYPESPFNENFDTNVLTTLAADTTAVKQVQIQIQDTLKWLCEIPKITSYRVNTLKYNPENVQKLLQEHVNKVLGEENEVAVKQHEEFKDILQLSNWCSKRDFEKYRKEVIVDVTCAAAVLRGAHIYVPGVLALSTGTLLNENVSIYADFTKKCKKGLCQPYDFPKIFLGNGVARVTRHNIFVKKTIKGIAIEVIETIGNCPPLGDDFLPEGSAILQNLPSIICTHVLNPQAGIAILDMCASPGNKTTHIAALMKNEGTLIAIDKTASKVNQLKTTCEKFGANVEIIEADSSKISFDYKFDRILLDAPCSVLGKRPQFTNTITEKVLKSYIPLQRKLFENAVQLLKPEGVLVYSTCTITLAENEGIVAWALKKFPQLRLVPAVPLYGGPGLACEGLDEEDLPKLQRFGPNLKIDSIGFFIAKFIRV